MLLIIKYNGSRFPRAVNLSGNKKLSFHVERKELILPENDALNLLKNNTQVRSGKFEFTVQEIVNDDDAYVPGGWNGPDTPEDQKDEENQSGKGGDEKPEDPENHKDEGDQEGKAGDGDNKPPAEGAGNEGAEGSKEDGDNSKAETKGKKDKKRMKP